MKLVNCLERIRRLTTVEGVSLEVGRESFEVSNFMPTPPLFSLLLMLVGYNVLSYWSITIHVCIQP